MRARFAETYSREGCSHLLRQFEGYERVLVTGCNGRRDQQFGLLCYFDASPDPVRRPSAEVYPVNRVAVPGDRTALVIREKRLDASLETHFRHPRPISSPFSRLAIVRSSYGTNIFRKRS